VIRKRVPIETNLQVEIFNANMGNIGGNDIKFINFLNDSAR